MTVRLIAAMLLLAVAGGSTAHAQYFGQNKVQYHQFDFKVLATEHFDIYYYPEEEEAVQLAARMAERWYARLSGLLAHELSSRQPLILYAAHPHFQQTNVLAGAIGEGTGGVTESAKRRVILPFAGGLAETDHVLGHEIVHAFQYDIAAVNSEGGMMGLAALPLWFIEGMAEYLSLGPVDANTAMWVRDASAREKMPTLRQLDDPNFFPYRYGHAFWAYVAARWGDKAVSDMLRGGLLVGDLRAVIEGVLDIDEEAFNNDWHEATRRTYASIIETTRMPDAFGRPLITYDSGGGEMNVSPALSPDGRRVVFLSERSMFAIEMYVADAATGDITRKLVETAGDPHFESLQFIESAGDWAPDNRRFVFSALSRGRPVLTILDVDSGDRLAEHRFDHLDQIFNPAWSPDGRHIAFSAMRGGVLDLHVFDLETGETRPITNDPFADYDPEWSPDGRQLAWVTDRFSANLDTLQFGGYAIGLIDATSGNARRLAGFDAARNTNPEFSGDGEWLYFISTPNGIPNVYRVSVNGGLPEPVTNVVSGVSGITPLTPALSSASGADSLVFTAFEDNRYNIYALDRSSSAPVSAALSTEQNAAVLPPAGRKPGEVQALLEAPARFLPQPQEYPEQEYKAGLSLDAIAQPTVGVGADRFGAYAAGGLSLLWSDMLGNHELGTTVLLSSRLEEMGGAIAYMNRTRRWNWGLIVDQTPYVTGGFGQFVTTIDGQPVLVQQELRQTQTNRGVSGVLQYPLNRAQRIEVGGGLRQISFTEKLDSFYYSAVTGRFLDETREELPSPDSIALGEATAALVYDTSIFGATSPILGQRYRFEYTQVGGTLDFKGALLDYRRYFMPLRPFTLAFRGMHYGRYGTGSDDTRLSRIYVGNPGLVRGYTIDSFDASECVSSAVSSCPVFSDLIGSRVAVGNVELRFPLLGVFSRRSFYGPLPIEVALFADAGVAWDRNSEPDFLGGDRTWARSVGTALRFNLLGFLIGELDLVKPLDRPGKGWTWQFNFTPGF